MFTDFWHVHADIVYPENFVASRMHCVCYLNWATWIAVPVVIAPKADNRLLAVHQLLPESFARIRTSFIINLFDVQKLCTGNCFDMSDCFCNQVK